MTYGWADQVLQPLMGVHYYEQVTERVGPKTTDFFRLFMVPGDDALCGRQRHGSVRSRYPQSSTGWRKAPAPDVLQRLSRRGRQGGAHCARCCPYPKVARYSGQGSIDEAGELQLRDALSCRRYPRATTRAGDHFLPSRAYG